jgi:sodium/potassium-transporting ATPase subunit alpha
LEQIATKFNTSNINVERPNQSLGLSTDSAEVALLTFGRNRLTPPKSNPLWKKFLKQFLDFGTMLMEVAALLCLIGFFVELSQHPTSIVWDNLYVAIVLICVILGTAFFTFLQEASSSSVLKGFMDMIPVHATVVRNGMVNVLHPEEIVPGDIVNLKVSRCEKSTS